ncbi:STAS domain-containing protein [Alicyclobacillus fastidiosus]|uniref:Anti-sigma factor antagonist n=1 Tax=Alicyclobacillus fastidiosus TaxID=392011 RepID=A0ABV5AIP4_9BACL|nr:STAS domain-containing protein [Alicyclobacillus fastidiosus]WEH10095.1 STAS domain-containing protein [Alicyclobacillus fastidiosus]
MSLSVEVKNKVNSVVVTVTGDVDFSTVHDLLAVMTEHREQSISIDCSGLSFIDSTGIGLILRTIMELGETGCEITLDAVPPQIQEILDEMGVSDILHELAGR